MNNTHWMYKRDTLKKQVIMSSNEVYENNIQKMELDQIKETLKRHYARYVRLVRRWNDKNDKGNKKSLTIKVNQQSYLVDYWNKQVKIKERNNGNIKI